MSRYLKSIFKKSRRYHFSLLENNKEFTKGKKRTTVPGQHGLKKQKLSPYGQQFQEKQKAKFMYGLTEKQFRNTFRKAKHKQGLLGENFLIMLESRLDNICFRLGLSQTRAGARQIVNHGRVLVNGKKVDIPSYQTQVGDVISLKKAATTNPKIMESLDAQSLTLPFVKFDRSKMEGTYLRHPKREELNPDIKESSIVEWYSRSI